jgi:ATP-dependent Clp protease protease subunit
MIKYYSMQSTGNEADIYIFGDILEPTTKDWCGGEADVSGFSLVQDLKALDASVINVHINSYGGHVSEGLAIHNMLKNHKAKVKTYCDGFACSAASVIFMAGDERIMNSASLLMIHNAWNIAQGDAEELRKQADDLDKITQASINAYMAVINIGEEKLKDLMDAESWILPADALEMGFATGIINDTSNGKATQSAKKALFSLLKNAIRNDVDPAPTTQDPEPEGNPDPLLEPDPEPTPQENRVLKYFNALMGGKD